MFIISGKILVEQSLDGKRLVNARLQSIFHLSFVTSTEDHFSGITGVLPKMIIRRVSLLMHWLAFME